MGDKEEYFPRGGKKPTTTRFKQSSNFLGGITQEDQKKKKPKKLTENDDGYLSDELVTEVDNSYKNCGLWLNHKVVGEGLLILGRVKEVKETKLVMSLPCRMQGMVMACHISEAYNQQLEAYVNDKIEEVSDLSKMFYRGQYVVVKVLEVTNSNQLMLSLMPQHINSGKIHSELRKGTLMQVAVTSVEDHGYIMDTGVPNTKAFLPKDAANPELELLPGGLCWCVIKSVSTSPDSSVVTLSGDLQYLQRAVQRHAPTNGALLPGTALEFTVDKPLDNGIEGHVLDNVTAYIQRHQVDTVRGKKPTLGQKIRARLLYSIPPSNIPYLTMKGVFDSTRPDLQVEQQLSDGDIVEEAQVMKIMGRSVYLKLADKGLGLLSLRRIRVDENLSDEDVVASSYPVGSVHKVRVLCYHLADQLYSVSDELHILAEKYFSLSELQPGQFVTATVSEVTDTLLRVDVGRLKGIIPLCHMTETGIFVDPKKPSSSKVSKKFKVGQEVNGRVLQVDLEKNKLVLTLKPSLLQPDLEPLSSYEDAQVGKAYTGIIKHIRDYLIVSFFNDVVAYVPRNFVTSERVDNFADVFHLAQIVKCTILCVKPQEKRMSASLTTPPFDPEAKRSSAKRQNEDAIGGNADKIENGVDSDDESGENRKKKKKKNKKTEDEAKKVDEGSNHVELRAGQFVSATVSEVADYFLRVDVGRLRGIVPVSHVAETGTYVDPKKASDSKSLMTKFKVGQEVNGRVLQVDLEKHKLVLTLKPSLLQPDLELLSSYEDAQVGKAYTGVVKYIRDYLLVSFFNDVVAYVPRNFATSERVDNLADVFQLAQIVKCTILNVKPQEKRMSASLTTAPFDPEAKRNTTKRQNEDTKIRNGKKAKLEDDVEENETHHEGIENKKKKNKKSKKVEEETDETYEENKASSKENDAIETDLQEECQVLAPEDLHLIDFSDCVTEKKLKKRVVSLIKAIKARTHRLKRVVEKITKIEENGLNAKNKKFHTAMHMEKIVVQERIVKLTKALEEGQNKLKEMNVEFKIDKKIKSEKIKGVVDVEPIIPQKKKKRNEEKTEEIKEKNNDIKPKRKDRKEVKSKEINVLDSLQPVIEVPSVKDFWLGNIDNVSGVDKVEESSSSDEEEEEKPKKKRKKLSPAEKVAKAREEEQRIRDLEKRAIESETQPRSNEQFQRALLATPDSSQLWIAYMAFHLQATEIEKARAVARKALATINFREESERLNVWLALLNLEHRFGNKESQQKTLEDALKMNDTYKVHTKLLDILVDTGKTQELSSVVELMLRRYRGSADVYRAAGAACYGAGLLDKARQVMQKGLTALEKKEHVTLLVNFAKLERSVGERERSEALFEQVLAVYPQRVDVASAYLDVLLKTGLVDQARQVLERLTSLQLPARKMKVLYKKWIEIEEKNGDEAHIQSIRQRAKDFLEKAKF